MRLTIAKKWKWLAMDDGGEWSFYTRKPVLCSDDPWFSPGSFCRVPVIFPIREFYHWRKSLHHRVGDEWVRVGE